MTAAPIYPIRLLSPTRRRITTTAMGSATSKQLQALGWTPYFGPATVYEQHKGGTHIRADIDPRNGFIVPGSDPALEPRNLPTGSFDINPHAAKLLWPMEACGICGQPAPAHVCEHCDRPCTGIGCQVCAAEAARYSRIP